jgi:hypothetical protein
MITSARPFLVLYVLWHPSFVEGSQIAETLLAHFRRKSYENVAGGAGLSVIFRCMPAPGAMKPLQINFDEAETTAVVALVDESFANDPPWVAYLSELAERTGIIGLAAQVFPVAVDASALRIGLVEQAIRWDRWSGAIAERQQHLIRALTYEFSRMLRHYLERLKRPREDEEALQAYLQRVQIFLSHSKHDADGQRVALAIRDWLHQNQALASFFDVRDIPAGVRFDKVILLQVKVSAVIAIHTDSYSSREWCRREIIEAKRWNVPLVVANCISDLDERGFPYMGNVPVVRMDPQGLDRIETIVGRLLDEVLKDFLWRCRVELLRGIADPAVMFVPRPPELVSLAGLPDKADVPMPLLVYPDPPLSAEEERLFEAVAPHVQLRSWSEWLAGAGR